MTENNGKDYTVEAGVADQSLRQEVSVLKALLTAAGQEFKEKNASLGRDAARKALIGVVWFLGRISAESKEMAAPFLSLLYAIEDLDTGSVAPILKPKKFKHRSPAAFSAQIYRALGAAMMELYIIAGNTPGEAARAAVGLINKGRSPNPTLRAKTLARWRNDIQNERNTGPEAIDQYTQTIEKYRLLYPNDLGHAAKEIAQALKLIPTP